MIAKNIDEMMAELKKRRLLHFGQKNIL